MSTPFYDLASLVVVPSGYKSGKIYAQKPLTTDGQLTFTRASTATRVNASGLIETVSSGVPRLDYLGSSCPKLQLEPQRTNKWFYSEAFDNAEWLKTELTVTANAIASPDGTSTADKITDTTANDEHRFRATNSLFAVSTANFSIFAKAAEYSKFAIANLSTGQYVKFDLSAGSVISTGTNFSNAKIENYGNGWYRLSATSTGAGNTHGYGLLNDAGDFVFTGTGTKGVYIWGAQAEEAAYATSYIPTTSAAVTRLADFDTSAGESGNFNLTPTGTKAVLYWEYKFNPAEVGLLINIGGFRNGTTNQYGIYYWGDNGGKFGFNSWNGDSYGIANGTGLFDGNVHKIAGVFDFSNFANNVLFIDGVKQTISQTLGTTLQRGAAKVSLNSPAYSDQGNKGRLQKFLYFNQNLTDAQLAELTTL